MAAGALKSSHISGDRLVAPLSDGSSISYTISTALQNRVERVMAENGVPFGVFVAIEPKTGKVLALTGYSSVIPGWGDDAFYKVYPMASLFKMVTACAALEQQKVEPETLFAFRGSSYSENPRYWSVNPKKVGQQMPLSLAMAKSINPVFGRLASDVVGRESIMSYAQRFGFNQTLFPGTSVVPSRAAFPKDDLELKLMGCGLGREVKISPFHAAMMMAALANQGTMLSPILVEEFRDRNNRVLPAEKSRVIRQLVTTETADKLSRMLLSTVTDGTSRRAFHDRQGRPKLPSVTICAKTGSINGTDPEGKYTWFAAYAPAEDPQIALVALVINQNRWKIKASRLGAEALEEFFAQKVPEQQTLIQGGYRVP
jgi:cell division protein FtsI/penicillin-binding protein 2